MLSLISHHRQDVEQAAIDRYYDLLIARGVTGYSRDHLMDDYHHGLLCTLVLLSLPMLSGEVSAEGITAQIFVYGMGVWRERMRIRFEEFDYGWMAEQYSISEQQARGAVSEMLGVIEQRLQDISEATATQEPLTELLRRNGVAHEFDV
jgi:hypothetical protein